MITITDMSADEQARRDLDVRVHIWLESALRLEEIVGVLPAEHLPVRNSSISSH